jgi:pyruvate/2-oxoglutarate dehydrogenase complex dihydrolipoamide acyltransferase (E2) component
MPPLGQTTSSAFIETWLCAEGDTVEMGQPLLVVETEKAQIEVESVADGVVLKIVQPAGAEVDVGNVIAYIGEGDEEPPA